MLVPRRIVGCRRNQQKKSGENDRTLHRSWRSWWETRPSPSSSGLHWLPSNRGCRILEECIHNHIYDEDDNMYKIASGTRKHQFICRMKNGEPFIKEKKSVSEHKKPKPNHKTSTETTHHPSQKGQDHSCSVC